MDVGTLVAHLNTAAEGLDEQEAAIWLLAEHGRWLPRLDQQQLILRDPVGPYARIKWNRISQQWRNGESKLTGTDIELQVLHIARAIATRAPTPLDGLGGLSETDTRLVLHAIAWAAKGQAWADALLRVRRPVDEGQSGQRG